MADRYAIERELGRGGMATVYLAEDRKHKRKVAIKVLHPELAATLGPDRFLREIEIAAQLSHPHILPLLDSGNADGFLYYVMPYVEGQSLRRKLSREGELPIGEVVRILREVVDALAEAHARGLVHRDIKPDNVLIRGNHVVVTDFGVAKAVSEATGRQHLTTVGVALGTPAYMAPEQAAANPNIDHRADIYAVGVMAYEMLTGRTPFENAAPEAILAAHVTQAPEPVTSRRNVPAPLADLVMQCLQKKPADRWQSANELLAHLELLTPTGTTPTDTRPVSATGIAPVRRGRWLVATSVAIVAAAAMGLALTWKGLARSGRNPGMTAPRLVVLPFENQGPAEDEYLADGITVAIRDRLSSLSGLVVIGPNSSAQYKNTTKAFRQIVEELSPGELTLDFVLSGTVFRDKANGMVQVRPRLVRANDETQIWAEPQIGAGAEFFKMQSDMAERVAHELDVKLVQQERQVLEALPTRSQPAIDLYLRGNAVFSTAISVDNYRAAADLYRKATVLDSTFALAYAGLSRATGEIWRIERRPGELLDEGRLSAQSALKYIADLPEAHIALGRLYALTADFENALKEYAAARRQRPGDADLLGLMASAYSRSNRYQEAVEAASQGMALDPRNVYTVGNLAEAHILLGQYAEAHRYYNRIISLAPTLVSSHLMNAMIFAAEGNDSAVRTKIHEVMNVFDVPALMNGIVSPYGFVYIIPRWLDAEGRDAIKNARLTSAVSNPDVYYFMKADVYRIEQATGLAEAYYDSARVALLATLVRPRSPVYESGRRALLGSLYARLGRRGEAITEANRSVRLVPAAVNAPNGADWVMIAAETYMIVGDYDGALKIVRDAWQVPGVPEQYIWRLRDPSFAPLRTNGAFQQLAAWKPQATGTGR